MTANAFEQTSKKKERTKMTKKEATIVCIKPIVKKTAKIRIIGDSPLIVHAWSEKAKKELLASQQGTKLKKDKKQAKNVYGEIAEALYWMNGKPDVAYADWTEELLDKYAASEQFGFPACAVKAAAVSAAFRLGWTKDKVSARGAFMIFGDNGSEFIEIKSFKPEGEPKFVGREDSVRIGMGTADLRYRPEFANWYMDVTISFNENGNFSLSDIVNMLNAGGDQCGLGEWRIEKGGSWGAFHVELSE